MHHGAVSSLILRPPRRSSRALGITDYQDMRCGCRLQGKKLPARDNTSGMDPVGMYPGDNRNIPRVYRQCGDDSLRRPAPAVAPLVVDRYGVSG
jgi:hypothetical protein